MNKIITALAAGLLSLSSISAFADDGVKYSLDTLVDLNSAYVFRGTTLYDGASIQPEITGKADLGDAGAFIADIWNHNSADNPEDAQRFTEVDYTLGYSIPVDIVTLGGGYTWYRYHNNHAGLLDTREFYLSAAVDTVANPTVTYVRDVDAGDYNYYDLTLSQKFEEVCGMGEGFNIKPYVTFGFASDAAGIYEHGGLVQTTVGVSSDLKLGDIAVTPNLNYSFESDAATDNQFWAGFTLGYSWL